MSVGKAVWAATLKPKVVCPFTNSLLQITHFRFPFIRSNLPVVRQRYDGEDRLMESCGAGLGAPKTKTSCRIE